MRYVRGKNLEYFIFFLKYKETGIKSHYNIEIHDPLQSEGEGERERERERERDREREREREKKREREGKMVKAPYPR